MNATKERWLYPDGQSVWVGKYLNSQNTLHYHSDCELIYAESGALDVTADGQTYAVKKGDAMFIDGGSLHMISATDPTSTLVTFIFDRKIVADFAGNVTLLRPLLSREYGIAEAYKTVFDCLKQKRGKYYTLRAKHAVYALMLDIFDGEAQQPRRSSKTDERLRALFDTVQSEYDSFTLAEAARFMGMNESYLSRLFSKRTGMRFMHYLNTVRVSKAIEMLRSGEYNVTETATRCGFGTIRNFNRIFKLLTGYSPTALPDCYAFDADRADGKGVNPTLLGCELIEYSSQKN